QWQGENISRFCSEEYDALHEELTKTADAAKRAEIGQQLNRMVYEQGGMIPLVHRGRLSAHSNTLGGVVLNVWDSELWNVADWHRKEGS
ncbi:peptide ABC transporter substrate-binding protein, partial [Cribrihabitans sp. XS_ASV171]